MINNNSNNKININIKEYQIKPYDYLNRKTKIIELDNFVCPVPLKDVLAIKYCIQRGNSHDESWQYKYIIINDNYEVPLNELKASLYLEPAIIKRNITDDEDKIISLIKNAIIKTEDKLSEVVILYVKE